MKKNQLIKALEKIPGNPNVCVKLGPPNNMLAALLTTETYKLHPKDKNEVIVVSDINPNWKEDEVDKLEAELFNKLYGPFDEEKK